MPEALRDELQKLPAARRAIAVARIEALERYLSSGRGSLKIALELAGQLGISRSRFYAMAKRWREAPSIDVVAPYSSARRIPKPKLAKQDAQLIDQAIRDALVLDRSAGTQKLTASVAATCRDAGVKPPSSATVARRADLIRRDNFGPAILRSSDRRFARAPIAFGDVIVVDHVIPDMWMQVGDRLTRPLLTLAIDGFTGFVLSFGLGPPSVTPLSVARALTRLTLGTKNLAETHERVCGLPMATEPRVIFNAGKSRDWSSLVLDITFAPIECDVIRQDRIARGSFARKLLGLRLGRLELRPRFSFRSRDELYRSDAAGIDPVKIYGSVREADFACRWHIYEHNEARAAALPASFCDTMEFRLLDALSQLEGAVMEFVFERDWYAEMFNPDL